MLYLALGAAILWFLVGLGRGQAIFKRRDWRIASGGFAIAAFAVAAYAGIRGAWEISIVLVVLGLWMVTTARINAARASAAAALQQDDRCARPARSWGLAPRPARTRSRPLTAG